MGRLWCEYRGRVIFAKSKTRRRQSGMLSIDELFKGRHFDREIIIFGVRWYLRFKLSFRDLVEMMAERGVDLAHTTIMRWVQRYVPEFERRWDQRQSPASNLCTASGKASSTSASFASTTKPHQTFGMPFSQPDADAGSKP